MEQIKKNLGIKAAEFIKNNQIVGLGTGSTANFFIEALSKKKINIKVVASSEDSYNLAKKLNIPLIEIENIDHIDIYVDGADEVDENKNMIKGRGAAFLKEKILASFSKKVLIIVDHTKMVTNLGKCPLPLEIIPFAKELTIQQLNRKNLLGEFRKNNSKLVITESQNYIYDLKLESLIDDPQKLENIIVQIPGVVETGLFLDMKPEILIGYENEIKHLG